MKGTRTNLVLIAESIVFYYAIVGFRKYEAKIPLLIKKKKIKK
jgi:hypothetical protein